MDTPTRESIVSFAEGAADSLPPEERVAVFDNDGALWCDRPLFYANTDAVKQRILALAGRVRIAASLDEAIG